MKPVAIVGWSGSGQFKDLERTAVAKLGARPKDASRVGDSLVVSAGDPVDVSRRIGLLPGVSWVAVGQTFEGEGGYLKSLVALAERYLSKGKTFRISAHAAGSGMSAGDLVLAGNSEILSSVTGSKVDERNAQVRFRVGVEGKRGVLGAEIRGGPGGTPTGGARVSCLVSGGERSACMAWMSALSGFSIRLVHAWSDDATFRQVAKLYAELSYRMDARSLELVVLRGKGSPWSLLGRWLREEPGAAFAAVKPRDPNLMVKLSEKFPNLSLPMVLVQDDAVSSVYSSLGLPRMPKRASDGEISIEALQAGGEYSVKRFGGTQADQNAVIDAVTGRV